MSKHGQIVRWDATRGFGFIRSPDTPADVFFHVRDLRSATLPAIGMAVAYEEIHVGGKGPRAVAVTPQGAAASRSADGHGGVGATPRAQRTPTRPPKRHAPRRTATAPSHAPATGQSVAVLLMLTWCGLLAWGITRHRLPLWVLAAALGLNVVTFFVYALDKSAAQRGTWRTSEQQLHLLALLGGWPAAWWAQQWLRHKSRKASFRAMYWLTVLLHCGALAAVATGWWAVPLLNR